MKESTQQSAFSPQPSETHVAQPPSAVALGSQRIRETGFSAISNAFSELNVAEGFWRDGALLWKSGQTIPAEAQFKLCADMLTGIAGILVEATGQTMHVSVTAQPSDTRDSEGAYSECSDAAVEQLAIIENGDYEEGSSAVFQLRKLLPNLDRFIKDEVEEVIERKAARPTSAPSGAASGADESLPSTTPSSGVEQGDKNQ